MLSFSKDAYMVWCQPKRIMPESRSSETQQCICRLADDIQNFLPSPILIKDSLPYSNLANRLKPAPRPYEFTLFQAPEAVENILRRVHGERRRLLLMERAARHPVRALLLQGHVVRDDADDVRLPPQVVYECLRVAHRSMNSNSTRRILKKSCVAPQLVGFKESRVSKRYARRSVLISPRRAHR